MSREGILKSSFLTQFRLRNSARNSTTSCWLNLAGLPLGLAVVLASALPSLAAVMLLVTTKQMVKEASHIVVGEVLSKTSFMKDGRIFTRYVIGVSETLKGEVQENRVELVEPGGVIPETKLGEKVLGGPDYNEGEKIFAFLGPTTDGAALKALHLLQGRMFVQKGSDGQEYLVRPPTDAHTVTISDFDSQGRNKNVCLCQVLNLQAPLALKVFRDEVLEYQRAFKAGEDPPLSEREQQLQKDVKQLMERAPLDPKEQVLKFHFPVQKRGEKYVLKRAIPVAEPAALESSAPAAGLSAPAALAAAPAALAAPGVGPSGGLSWGWHLFFILLIVGLAGWEIWALRARKRRQPSS